jgi:prealbumin domain-containing protein
VGFAITVTNIGAISTTATVSDLPLVGSAPGTPAGNAGTLSFSWLIDVSGSDAGCTIAANALTCNFGSIAPGGSKRVHITALAIARSDAQSRADNCGQRIDNVARVTLGDGSQRQSQQVTVDIVCLPSTAAGALTITKYSDDNANGRRDESEQSLAGWTFEIRNATTGQTRTATTGISGSVVVEGLEFGQYTVTETGCASPCDFTKWQRISYSIADVTVMSSAGTAQVMVDAMSTSIAFGNRLPRLPSTSTSNGATAPDLAFLLAVGMLAAVLVIARGARRRFVATL